MRSSAEQRAMELREAHRGKVARNEVRASPLWARPCRGYNVSDPAKFLAMLEDTNADATAEADELVVLKELVYPSLEAEVLARLPLASR